MLLALCIQLVGSALPKGVETGVGGMYGQTGVSPLTMSESIAFATPLPSRTMMAL
jgi:hypothetical protein